MLHQSLQHDCRHWIPKRGLHKGKPLSLRVLDVLCYLHGDLLPQTWPRETRTVMLGSNYPSGAQLERSFARESQSDATTDPSWQLNRKIGAFFSSRGRSKLLLNFRITQMRNLPKRLIRFYVRFPKSPRCLRRLLLLNQEIRPRLGFR